MSDGSAGDDRRTTMRRRRLRIVPLVLALAALAGWWLTARSADDGKGGASPAARVVPVRAVAARTGDVHVYLDGIGTVTPLASVTVRTRVDGELMAVRFHEGDQVAQGELLAEIDPRPFQVQLEQAQGQMARDQALLENARVDLKRYKTLVAQDSIPKQQLDTQDSLVRQYQAALASDQAQIDQAKLQLDYAHVTAPIAGRLGLRLVDPGNIVHASDTGGLVVLDADAADRRRLPDPRGRPAADPAQAARRRDAAGRGLGPREPAPARARAGCCTLDNAIDPATGTVRVKAEFANEDEALFPNQFVNARLLLEVRHDAILVPSPAIQHGTDGTFVYVVGAGDTVELRPVEVGAGEDDDASITKGLAAGELVVVDGAAGAARRHRGLAARRRRRDRGARRLMNVSRPFILRPVATTLLMVAILLGGALAYRAPAGRGAAAGRLPDDPGGHVLSGREPGRDGVVGHRPARAPVRPDARPRAHDVDQLERQLADHPAVRARPRASTSPSRRCRRRSTRPARSCRDDLPNPPVYSKVNPADAPILTLALTSTTLPLPEVEDLAETRLAQKIAEVPGVGLVSISGGQRPAVRIRANPTALAAYGLTLEEVRAAIAAANVNQAKGSFDGPRAAPTPSAPTTSCCRAPSTRRWSSPTGTARRSACPTSREVVDGAENVKQAAWMTDANAARPR